MSIWLIALLLGLIEGITEFIPVSSTGHLLLAEQFLRVGGQPLHHTFFGTEVFNAVIQCGAMLAALPLFSARLATLRQWRVPAQREYFLQLGAAFMITIAGALIMKKLGLELPDHARPIAVAMLVGGVLFVVVERWLRGRPAENRITWTLAVAFGLAQLIAIAFPGSSRSGSTILVALMLGLARGPATEFSFLLGVPTLCAAGAKTLLDAYQAHETILWGPLLLATAVAGVASVLAVRWLLRYVQTHTFTGFGFYRIALGGLLLLFAR